MNPNKAEPYFQGKKNVVTLNVLRELCERISGMSHRFEVVTEGRNVVAVEYSNPNEYGFESPQTATFPCYFVRNGKEKACYVVLDYLRITNDPHDVAHQSFDQLIEHEAIYRNPDNGQWETEAEIKRRLGRD